MTKTLIISVVGLALVSFTIGAEDKTKKISPVVEHLTPRPIQVGEFCPRSGTQSTVTVLTETSDIPVPQHCLEPNCGLGVYSKHENETVEKCSYCGTVRPEKN